MKNASTTILIIDDEPAVLQSMADYLEDQGFQVRTAQNGRVGLEVMEGEHPDLVLTDLRMPEVDGLVVLKRIREIAPEIPLIVISGTGNVSDSIQAIRLGAWDYILKPIEDLSIVSHAVDRALERARLLKENRVYQESLEALVAKRTQELEQANAHLSGINARLRKVVHTAQGLSGCSNITEFGETILTEFAAHMLAAGGSLFIREKDGLRLLHTLDPGHVPMFIPFPLPEQSVLRRVIESRNPLLIEDIAKDNKQMASGWSGYLNGSALIFPLPDEAGHIVGVLTLHSKTPPPFIEQDREIGSILASYSCETLRATHSMEELRISEQHLRDLAEMLPEAVFETDPDFNLTFANRRAFELFRYSREDFSQGLNGVDMLAPEERKRALENFRKQTSFEDFEAFEYKGIRKDGSTFPMLFRLNSIIEKNALIGYRGVIVDITERKRAEEALQKSENKYRTIINESPVGILYFDQEGTILECNKKFVTIIGSSYESLIGMNMLRQLKDVNMIQAVKQALRDGESFYEGLYSSVTAEKKTYVKVLFKGIRHEGDEVTSCVGLVEDISEQRIAEEEQRISERRYRTLFDQATDAFFLVDRQTGRYLDANKAAEKITGRSLMELKQLTTHDVTPSGSSARLRLIAGSEKSEKLGQVTYVRPDGQKRIAALRTAPLDDGIVIGIARDITDELAMENHLRQAQKMEAIGTLAGGIAHDFNNILSAIIGYAELLLADISPGDPARNKVTTIFRAGERARDLVSRILTFSRSEEPIRSPVQMDQVIHEALTLLRPAIPTTIEIRKHIETRCHVYGEPTRLQQIVMNLCTNAYHSMEDTFGVLTISLAEEEVSEQAAAVYQLAPGTYMKLSISDTGCGIPPDHLERIFDPYFTTKEKGKGTGLGLSMVLGIVKNHGGAISVESQVGKGTRFDVFLPKARVEEDSAERMEYRASGGRESILLVDDEKDITDVQTEMLKRLGYHVTATNRADDAVAQFTEHPEQFDLVITDMTMPKMTGLQLSEKLRQIHPEIGIIICSGYQENASEKSLQALKINAFVQKPVIMSDLAKMVRKVLDGT
jgi:PAS domain S-box-containing protein